MRRWLGPFLVGLLLALSMLAAAWLGPAFLPASVTDAILKPEYRMDKALLEARFMPEVTASLQRALVLSAAAVLAGYVVVSLVHLTLRPAGPGGAASRWRHILWVSVLLAVAVCAAGATYASLTIWMTMSEDAAATQWTAFTAAAAALTFWLVTVFGSERMMRPAVPLASWMYPA
jgi:hypothetical protein